MERTDLETQVNSFVLSQNDIAEKPIFAYAEVYEGKEIDAKEKILCYLKSVNPTWFTSQPVEDMIRHTKVNKADNIYSDGVFEWSETDIYHFEHYDMPLSEEFITHCLDQTTEE